MTNHNPNRFPCIGPYCRMMGSFRYYTEAQLAEAAACNAPEDTTSIWQGQAHRLSEAVVGSHTWQYFKANHPELFERFAQKEDPNRDERGNWIGNVAHENGWTP